MYACQAHAKAKHRMILDRCQSGTTSCSHDAFRYGCERSERRCTISNFHIKCCFQTHFRALAAVIHSCQATVVTPGTANAAPINPEAMAVSSCSSTANGECTLIHTSTCSQHGSCHPVV